MSSRTLDEQQFLEKIRRLSPEKIKQVEKFVEFLASKEQRRAAMDRLLSIAPALEDAGAPPIGDEEAVALAKQARAERLKNQR